MLLFQWRVSNPQPTGLYYTACGYVYKLCTYYKN